MSRDTAYPTRLHVRSALVGVGGVTSYISNIWHSTDVRLEWPPFSALPGI